MKKCFVWAVFSLLIASTSPLAHATSGDVNLDISKAIWGVTKFAGDEPNKPRLRKIAFNSFHQFKLAVDCDYYKGRYQVEGNLLRISTLIKVAGGCAEAKTKTDSMFLNALLAVDCYELTNESLKLLNAKGELIVQLEPTTTFDLPASKAKAGKKHRKSKKIKADKKVTNSKAIKGHATKPKALVKTSATVKKAKLNKAKKVTAT